MSKSRSAIAGFLAILFFLSVKAPPVAADAGDDAPRPTHPAARVWLPLPLRGAEPAPRPRSSQRVQVTLSAPFSTTSWDERDPQRPRFDLPLLYLHREREGTTAPERTLGIEIVGLAAGAELQVELRSWHVDVSTAQRHAETRRFSLPDRPCTFVEPCTLQWVFEAATMPSDLYTLRIQDANGKRLWSNPQPERTDFVALDTWDVRFGEYVVRTTYATLFPFARGPVDLDNRLTPGGVTDFIEGRFVPLIADTWRTQVHDWGFGEPFHPDWDADRVVEIFMTAHPFALFDGTGTYTVLPVEGQTYPQRRIWWYASNGSFQRYDSLENGCRVIFAHEFFHLMQWNVLLNTAHPTSYWLNVFIEAQGRLAQSVQYPELELHTEHLAMDHSDFVKRSANRFLGERLNVSYQVFEADPTERYDAALYWRFLYEQFGGMEVVRVALQEMADREERDIVAAMGRVMNRTFAQLDGPFQSFEESLVAFARANYALRLDCASQDRVGCGGNYYDPDTMYRDPPLEARINYKGGTRTYDGALPASFGMDFVQVSLDPALRYQPLTVTVKSEGGVARFNVQIWELGPGRPKPRALTPQPEIVPQNTAGAHVYVIPQVDRTAYDTLALIVTRLDPDERLDPAGKYRITLESPAHSDDEKRNPDLVIVPGDGSVPG